MDPVLMFQVAVFIALFLFAITFHEVSHGWIAYLLGDPTAKESGRLTLNPLRHIDPLWTIAFPVLLVFLGMPAIGMAKPVPVNYLNLRRPKQGMIWVGLAGPCSNLLCAVVLSTLYRWWPWNVWLLATYLNLGLAVFNLVPIPPLDGSRVLIGILPSEWARRYHRLEPFGFPILLGLVWFGLLWPVVIPGINFFCDLLEVPKIAIGSRS
jgi:Zn-dependent protease